MKNEESKQVFLGGACGLTTWRKDISIPLFEEAQVSYHNPQMPLGAWKEDDQFDEMKRKDECLVQLFVINGSTRGVASVAEVAYLIGARKPVAIVLEDIKAGADVYGATIDPVEADDLNRGRIFVRAMADRHNVPIFTDIVEGTKYCIKLVKELEGSITIRQIENVLTEIQFSNHVFQVEEAPGGFHIWISGIEQDSYTGKMEVQEGRKWFINARSTPSDVVRTVFKSVSTWAEHEARESFKYKGVRVFSPHLDLDKMVNKRRDIELNDVEEPVRSKPAPGDPNNQPTLMEK
ncbi:MAG: nucleoside 2-deoxyribosyltransferase domain-containing protein [Candidatus Melainabacteria bacterium]|nr:nucleoside 2-deoxyribosyltransferase domain-containing protein [Candidatus Melainabacteria bacterium]